MSDEQSSDEVLIVMRRDDRYVVTRHSNARHSSLISHVPAHNIRIHSLQRIRAAGHLFDAPHILFVLVMGRASKTDLEKDVAWYRERRPDARIEYVERLPN